MRIKAIGAACLVAGSMLAAMQPSTGWAQGTGKDTTASRGTTNPFSIAAEVGWRGFTSEPNDREKGKFLEYKDIHAGPVVQQLLLSYTPADSFGVYQFVGRNLTDADKSMAFRASRPGLYDLQARYDGIPHTFSTTARMLGSEPTDGYFSLPVPRPDSTAWRAAPYLAPIRTLTTPVKLSLGITPSPALDFKAEYTQIGKVGQQPLSLTFATSSGPTREYPAPIDQTVHDIRISQGYANKTWQVLGSYAYSKFQNANRSAEIESPINATDTPANGAAMSRVALPPDNSAQTAAFTGAVNLPSRTRVMASATLSWFSQNAAFLPATSNSLHASDPLLVLPRNSLDGQTRTSVVNVSATSRPTTYLTLAARYRTYSFSDQTAPFHIRATEVSDRAVTPSDSFTSQRLPFSKDNAEFSASYRFANSLALTGAYAWEGWTRDPAVRNIAKTNEATPRVSIDWTGIDWMTVRGSYLRGSRRGNNYEDSTASFNNFSFQNFRRYDQADRDRDRKNFVVSLAPTDQVNLVLAWQFWNDTYPNSPYGVQRDKSNMLGADVDWSPNSRFSIGAGYSLEDIDYLIKERYRTGTATSATWDNPSYVWFSQDKGTSTTMYVNFTAVVIPDKLTAGGTISSADSRFKDLNYNVTTPTGGTVAQNYAATAFDFPEVWSRKQPLALFLTYRYAADWAFTVRYQFETYRQNDFRTTNPACYNTLIPVNPPAVPTSADPGCTNAANIPAGSDLTTALGAYRFLGNNYRNYDAGWLTLLFSYRPSALRFMRGRSAL